MKPRENQLPEQMTAIRQHEPGGALKTEQVAVPRPGPGEVVVKMDASPINPSDLALMAGGYLERSYPFTPGLEGSGTVVEAGSGLFPKLRLGKRVACSPDQGGDGTWADYMKTSAMKTAPLPKHISPEQGSMMLVNPMTAMAFIQLAREGKHRAMVNNAAASSLGKMLIRLTKSNGIPLINIVRRAEQVDALKELGAIHVLNSTAESFAAELKELAEELEATLILDAVTGSQSSTLLDAAPHGSTLVAYARLSGDPILADPGALIKEEKEIVGFQLGNWLQTKGILFKLRFINSVKRQLSSELSSTISRTYPLESAEEAIAQYREHMSEGKIVLKIGSY
ncbi:MAG: zinc-binding dehydrogenase [Bacteroidales bacterium]|nr:zinc-binding dehydrogenase [Bacteroidales bacterium]